MPDTITGDSIYMTLLTDTYTWDYYSWVSILGYNYPWHYTIDTVGLRLLGRHYSIETVGIVTKGRVTIIIIGR